MITIERRIHWCVWQGIWRFISGAMIFPKKHIPSCCWEHQKTSWSDTSQCYKVAIMDTEMTAIERRIQWCVLMDNPRIIGGGLIFLQRGTPCILCSVADPFCISDPFWPTVPPVWYINRTEIQCRWWKCYWTGADVAWSFRKVRFGGLVSCILCSVALPFCISDHFWPTVLPVWYINRTDTPAVLIKHLTPGDPSNATVYHASSTYDHLDWNLVISRTSKKLSYRDAWFLYCLIK